MLNPYIAGSGELLQCQCVFFIGGVELLDAEAHGPLRTEFRQGVSDLVAIDTVAAKIRTSTYCVLYATPGHDLFHHRRYVSNLVVLFRAADVERLVMNEVSGCMENCQERATDVFDMNQRAPWRSVTSDQDLACGVSKTDEIVYDQVGT